MPISANKLVYDFERKLNILDSGRINDFRVVDIVSFINDSYEAIIEHIISEKDQNETIRNHLRPLMKTNVCLKCKKTKDCNVCEIEYPEDFYEIINIRVLTCKDCCNETKEFSVPKPQGDDIDEARNNPYRRANFYFEQLLCYESEKGLRFYHENEMEIKKVCIDYYRKIQRIEAAELVECEDNLYRNWDGELITNNVDFEIDSTYLNRKITEVAVLFASNASRDYNMAQSKLQEILQTNQLYK